MLSAGPGYLTERFTSAIARLRLGDVAERDNTDQPLFATEYRQPPDLDVAHVRRDLVEILVVITVLDLGGHDIADPRIGPTAQRNPADGNVAVGNHSDEALIIGDREQADAKCCHRFGRIL